MSGQQMYMEPVNYFVPSKSEVGELQKEAAELRSEVDDLSVSWVNRTRSAERLKDIERRIQAYRAPERQAQQPVKNQQAQQQQARPTLLQALNASASQAGRFVECDGGGSFLWIPWSNDDEQVGNVGAPERMYAALGQ